MPRAIKPKGQQNGTAAVPPAAPIPPPSTQEQIGRLMALFTQPPHRRPMVTLPVPFPVKLPPHSSKDDRADNNSKLTNEIAEKVLSAKRGGASDLAASAWAGISPTSLSRWRHHAGEPYETFRALLAEAESYPKMFLLDAIMSNAYHDPKIALELLARLEPETYGKVVVIEDRTNPLGSLVPPVNGVAGVFSADLGQMLERILARKMAQGQAPPGEPPLALSEGPQRARRPALVAPAVPRPKDPRPPKPVPQAAQAGGKR